MSAEFCPVIVRAIVWAEKKIVLDPGTDKERVVTKRSRETALISATTPEEFMQGLLDSLGFKNADELFAKKPTAPGLPQSPVTSNH